MLPSTGLSVAISGQDLLGNDVGVGMRVFSGVTSVSGFGIGRIRFLPARVVTNPVPQRLARVVRADINSKTLGAPYADDVFVTAADDIAGMNATQIAERLSIPRSSSGFKIIEFDTPHIGLSSPINRTNEWFIGFGRTAGGAREFALPNQVIPEGAIIKFVK
jgi:hypothetical protein